MLLAEMVASGELQSIGLLDTEIALNRPVALKGVPLADGVGLGYVVLHEPRIIVKQLVAEDVKAETERLETAIDGVRESIDKLIERGDLGHGEHREVLEAFRMFAYDRGWIRRLREAVATGLTAEAAVERVQNDARARLQRQTDPYLRERLHDLDDLANRLLYQLAGRDFVTAQCGTAGQRHHRRAHDGAGGAARLRSHQIARHRAGRCRPFEPCRDRRPRARHCDGRRSRQYPRLRRAGRRRDRRWLDRRRAGAPAAGCRKCLCRKGAAARPPAGAISQAARRSLALPRMAPRSNCI